MQGEINEYNAEVWPPTSSPLLERMLNKNGQEGWRLRGHESIGRHHTFYFQKTDRAYEYQVVPSTLTELTLILDLLSAQARDGWRLALIIREVPNGPDARFIFIRQI